MRMFAAGFLAIVIAVPAFADDWTPVVVIARAIESDSEGNITVRLPSGKSITLTEEDWSEPWSEAVHQAMKNQEMERAVRSDAEPPTDSQAASMIRSKCASEWPDDYQMRKYCEDQQYEALRSLRARRMTGQLASIRAKCASEWPDDFQMRDYCEEQQLKAWRELYR